MTEHEESVYDTTKALYHDKIVAALKTKQTHKLDPTFVHLMPQNVCNQSCHFCSYRLKDWKNSEEFDVTKSIPWSKMKEILEDLATMNVKAVEITGGGEPLAYPHKLPLLEEVRRHGFEVGLVTNGTLLTDDVAEALAKTRLRWVRVSIDSSNADDYAKIRNVSTKHYRRAWEAIDRLVKMRQQLPTLIVGAGFVVTEENYEGTFDFCQQAKAAGVDNVRISFAFTPQGQSLLDDYQHGRASRLAAQAVEELNDDSFTAVNLFDERWGNILKGVQDYDYCPSKDLLCVIEGECKVYTCCTLTGSPHGFIGSVADQRFLDLWRSKAEWRAKFDVRKHCRCACLYEKRNCTMNAVTETGDVPDLSPEPPDHVNFI